MSLVRVWTDVGQRKPKALLAKIFQRNGGMYTIRYLSAIPENAKVFRYEDEEYEVDDESISEWLETDLETDIGYEAQDGDVWAKVESDSDYDPESESESDDDEEEEEEEDDDEDEEEFENTVDEE